MTIEKFSETNAHEGPICVPWQNRVYFTTKPNFATKNSLISINYLDLHTKKIQTFIKDANMANSLFLTNDKKYLLAAEQGTLITKGGISKIDLNTAKRQMLVNEYRGKPFNSPNKVIQTSTGMIYFSDPNYGYYQKFKDTPKLKNGIYAFNPQTNEIKLLSTVFQMPHGLAFNEKDHTLLIGDTAAINGRDPYDPKKTHDIYQGKLINHLNINNIRHLVKITPGIPDGFIIIDKNIYVAAGDGIQRYDLKGRLIEKYSVPGGAVNLTHCNNTLYVTADTAIYKIDLI